MVILFYVGGPIMAVNAVSSWWVPSLIFEFWIACIRIYVLPTLNLMLGLNSAANFTPTIIFSSHNMNDFTMYTYNKKAPMTGLDVGPMMALVAWPCDSPTASQLSLGLHLT